MRLLQRNNIIRIFLSLCGIYCASGLAVQILLMHRQLGFTQSKLIDSSKAHDSMNKCLRTFYKGRVSNQAQHPSPQNSSSTAGVIALLNIVRHDALSACWPSQKFA